MKMSKALRGNRDLPQLESINLNSQAAAGSGADYEHCIVNLPNLRQGAPAMTAGMTADNTMSCRWFTLLWEAALTGANTNYCTLSLLQRRGGVLLVNTTSSTAVVAAGSSVTVTTGAAGAVNCYIGQYLNITGGTGTAETVVVSAVVDATHFTAYFANTHSGTYTITSAPLATISYLSGTNDAAWVTRQIACYPNTVKPGDVLTVSRLSFGTGLATPAVTVGVEWVEGGPQ